MTLRLHDEGGRRLSKAKCFQYLGCCNVNKHCRSHSPAGCIIKKKISAGWQRGNRGIFCSCWHNDTSFPLVLLTLGVLCYNWFCYFLQNQQEGRTGVISLHCVGCLDAVCTNSMVFPQDSLAPIMEEQELKLGLPLRLFQDATAGIKEFIGTFYWKFSSESCFDIY